MSTLQNTLLHHLRSLAAKQAGGAISDRQLLEEFLSQRSETAFAALVRRHGPMVWSVCRRVLHNHHDAEDAFQAVFLVLIRKAANIRKQEMAVVPRLRQKQAAPLAYFLSQIGESSLPRVALPAHVLTDAEGRFRIDGFVSGLNYSLTIWENGKDIAQKEIAIKAGAMVDVGAIKMKTASEKQRNP